MFDGLRRAAEASRLRRNVRGIASRRLWRLRRRHTPRPQVTEDAAKKREQDAKKAMDLDRINKANHGAYNTLVPRMVAWQNGEGDASAVRRFKRRQARWPLAAGCPSTVNPSPFTLRPSPAPHATPHPLPTAHCPLSTAHGPRPTHSLTAYRLLPTTNSFTHCEPPTAHDQQLHSLRTAYCPRPTASLTANRLLPTTNSSLRAACPPPSAGAAAARPHGRRDEVQDLLLPVDAAHDVRYTATVM